MRWVEHTACVGETNNANTMLVGKE